MDSIVTQDTAFRYFAWLLYLGLVLIIGSILYNRFFHSLARFPGPFAASFSNIWKTYYAAIGDYEHVLLALHREHGRIIRIGPNHINVSDASAVKTIYGSGRQFK